jgi:hypothetical protein
MSTPSKNIRAERIIGTLDASEFDISGNLLISGDTQITGDLSATTISATTYLNLPTIGGGGDYLPLSGGTVTGDTEFTSGLTATTISNVDYIDFDSTYTGNTNHIIGRLNWSIDDGTLEIGMGGAGEVTQQIGLEQFFLVKNQTGSQLNNGTVIRASGTLGSSGRILADYMIADGTIPFYYTMGIATQNIADGDDGYVTNFGLVRGINTTGSLYGETWSDGDILYVSPTIAGGLTNSEPNEPNLKIQMALVIKADANGSIFVRPDLGYKLGDLHDLQTSGATNGDLIAFDSSDNIWKYSKTLNGNYVVNGNLNVTGTTTLNTLVVNNITPNVQTVSSSATVTPTSTNNLVVITGQTTTLTLANPTGVWSQGQDLIIRIKDNGTSRTINYGNNYRAIGTTLPTSTTANKTIYLGIIYNSTDTKWDIVGVNIEE